MEDVTTDQFHQAYDLLVRAVLVGMKHEAPLMKAQRSGRIINNASVAALRTG